MVPHNSPAKRDTVAVTYNGTKIGTGTVSANGTVSILLTHPEIVKLMSSDKEIQHLSIDPTFKEK